MAQDALHAAAQIKKLRFELARLKRAQFGRSSEKLDERVAQLELAIETLEADGAEGLALAPAVAEAIAKAKPARRPLPEHLPREEVVHPGPCACPGCGGRLRVIGQDVTETLDYVPGRFKVVRHVREAFSCRSCETVVQAPAPHHAIARGRAGPGLLAHIAVAKFDDHLPLHRQAEIYACEGVTLETSTLAGWVGATAAALMPLVELLRRDVIATSEVLHGDDTPVPILNPGAGRARAGRGPAGYGPTSGTNALGMASVRRRPCSSPRPTGEATGPHRISPPSPASCRLTAMLASSASTTQAGSRKPPAGRTSGASSMTCMPLTAPPWPRKP